MHPNGGAWSINSKRYVMLCRSLVTVTSLSMTGRALAVAVGEIRSECRGPNHSPGQRSGHRTHLHN